MPFCFMCKPLSCGAASGLTSITWATRGQTKSVGSDCGSEAEPEYIAGPVVGSISISAYGFGRGQDIWGGSRCQGQAQASQQNIQKYDMISERHLIIPTREHSAQIVGNVGSAVTMTIDCYTTTVTSKIVNGATITTEMETALGHELNYTGQPMAVSFPFVGSYRIFGFYPCYLSSFSYSVEFPTSPASVTYEFQFIGGCESLATRFGPSLEV